MKRTEIKKIFKESAALEGQTLTVCGWCRTIRASNAFGFIELNDGSCFKNLQIVFVARCHHARVVVRRDGQQRFAGRCLSSADECGAVQQPEDSGEGQEICLGTGDAA